LVFGAFLGYRCWVERQKKARRTPWQFDPREFIYLEP
jgi:hypothetical protein